MNIDHSEVLFKAMAHKDDANIHEVAYLLVGGLECGQVSVRDTRVKVPRFDPRVLCKVIYNLQGTKTEYTVKPVLSSHSKIDKKRPYWKMVA